MERNDILLIHGTDYKEMTKKLFAEADLAEDIGDKKKKIALKPNIVNATPSSNGATTHAELLAGTIEYLQENGFSDITIMEGSWVGDRTSEASENRHMTRRVDLRKASEAARLKRPIW